jgi:hypothetical protein
MTTDQRNQPQSCQSSTRNISMNGCRTANFAWSMQATLSRRTPPTNTRSS